MKLSRKFLSIAGMVGLSLMMGGNAWAQSSDSATGPETLPAPPGADAVFFERVGPPEALGDVKMVRTEGMGFVGFEAGLDGKTVTGAPFTATFSTDTNETLTDGNKISHSSTGTIARDTQGRTRRDMTLPAIGPWSAEGKNPPQVSFINDPVAGTRYALEMDKKIARQMPAHQGHPKVASAENSGASKDQVTTNSLGTQTINGLPAQGTRYTRTIPAGEIGNEKPIVIVTERWYSADLQAVIMTKRTDPRMGETDFQLTNIQRAEPAATLFQVPADFTIEQGGHNVIYKMKAPAE